MTQDKIVQLSPDKIKYSSVEMAISAIRSGSFVVVADDEGRENEGDLICAASLITPEMVNFMAKEARGLICVSITPEVAENLNLPQMVEDNNDPHQTAFTISIDAGPEFNVSTGISAFDRATTIQRLAASNATAQDFRRPGHIFPVQARKGGVLRRVGHTEAAMDLTRLAGLPTMGVICEIMNDDGNMARRDDLAAFAKKHNLPFITITQLITYMMANESDRFVSRRVVREIDTRFGTFNAVAYVDNLDGCEHLALVKGSLEDLPHDVPYVRVQHENPILDVLGKTSSEDVPAEMAQAMAFMEEQGKGVVVYLRHRDDAYGLVGSLKAYHKETAQSAYRSGKADLREYGVGAQILADLGVKRFNLLGNSTKKIIALRGYGLEVMGHTPMAEPQSTFDFAPLAKIEAKPVAQPVTPEVIEEAKTAAATTAQNQNKKPETPKAAPAPKAEERPLVAEPRLMTMKMGGQILSGQALFEG